MAGKPLTLALYCVLILSFLMWKCQAEVEVKPIEALIDEREQEHKSDLHHRIPKDMCKILLKKFSQSVSDYAECTTSFARPIELCLRCRDQYLDVHTFYEALEDFNQDNVSCKIVLTKQDRLNIIGQMFDFTTGSESMWEKASCKNCYEKNDPTELRANHTMTFMHLWNDTITCFKRFIDINLHPEGGDFIVRLKPDFQKGSLCQNCSDIYDKMRNYFWDEVIPTTDKHTLNGVCYDIRDAFNLTGIIWKDHFNCEPKPQSWALIPIVSLTVLLIIVVYMCEACCLPKLLPKRVEQKVSLVQQDIYDGEIIEAHDDSMLEVDGSFEVVPGVSAEEYIQRFRPIEVVKANGRSSTIRVPPPPEEFYDLEWNNDEWILPPKEIFIKMNEITKKFKDGEITMREMDLLHCKIILQELDKKKKKSQKRRHVTENSAENVMAGSVNDLMTASTCPDCNTFPSRKTSSNSTEPDLIEHHHED